VNSEEIKQLLKRVESEKEKNLIHIPYSQTTGLVPDFEVSYEISPSNEIDRVSPKQGLRCDFMYEGDNPKIDGIYMIWPEFLNKDGSIITDKTVDIDLIGRANMWILRSETRQIHRKRIKVGIKGYWMAGSMKIARVEVTKIIGLYENE